MEGDKEFTGNTMPNRDLILTSKYTEKPAEDIMIYYGSKLINELDMFNNENITNNLNSFSYDETITNYGNLTPPFKQPTLNNDNVWEEFYDKLYAFLLCSPILSAIASSCALKSADLNSR